MKGYPTYASAAEYFGKVNELLRSMPQASEAFVEALWSGFEEDRTIFLIGNGGSAANASHFGQDLAKGTLSSMDATRRFRVISLTDNIGFITALANDEGYDSIFEQQLRNLAKPGDLLVAISGSGNSPNVIQAVEYARSIDMKVIGVTGYDGGKLKPLSDVSVHVPIVDMGMTEAIHVVVFHLVMNQLRTRLAGAQ